MSGGQSIDQLEIDAQWDAYNTGLLTDKLYRHVARGEFDFDLDARSGSLLTTFAVGVGAGITATVACDLAKYLVKRHRRSDSVHSTTIHIISIEGEEQSFELDEATDIETLLGTIEQLAGDRGDEADTESTDQQDVDHSTSGPPTEERRDDDDSDDDMDLAGGRKL